MSGKATVLECAWEKNSAREHVTGKSPSLPGTVGTPAFFIVSRAVDLSPITRILSGYKIVSNYQVSSSIHSLLEILTNIIMLYPV